MAVETAKRVLEESEPAGLDDFDLAVLVGRLRSALRGLLEIAEAQPKSARMRLQHDQEFLNLARAARMEIGSLAPLARRLDGFLQALSAMVEHVDGEDGGRS